MEKIAICPSCLGKDLKDIFLCKDYFLSQENFNLLKCTNCGLIITSPQPDKTEISDYYKSENYISHKARSNSVFDILYKSARNISIRNKVNIINRLNLDRSILDIGCGTGTFLQGCAKHNWRAFGVEPNEQARQIASSNPNCDIKSDINQLDIKEKVSVVTLWHVLEHVHDLQESLSNFHKILHDDGKLIIAVPNHESYDAQLYQQYWAAFDVPRHLYHFSRTSLDFLLKKNNFCIDKVIPLKLDSFYISLLSEKYKTGHKNWLKSLLNGYKSNIYGRNTGNYSSLIYIASKC